VCLRRYCWLRQSPASPGLRPTSRINEGRRPRSRCGSIAKINKRRLQIPWG
jgi:hypothetical protein